MKNILEMGDAVMENLNEYAVLLNTILNNEFTLHYQPIVDAATTDVLWVEALMRWNNPIIGDVSPEIFIPLMEENNIIIPAGLEKWDVICFKGIIFADHYLQKMFSCFLKNCCKTK